MSICCPNCQTIIQAIPSRNLSPKERLLMQVTLVSAPADSGLVEDCWIWTGASSGIPDPYGTIMVLGESKKSHRLSYEIFIGAIADGLQLDHLCRRTLCCSPTHLEPVTSQVNILRSSGPAAHNALKTHCKNGHLFDEVNTIHRKDGGRKCRTCHYAIIEARRRKSGVKVYKEGKAGRPPTWVPSPAILES